jgi:hypothetical protein
MKRSVPRTMTMAGYVALGILGSAAAAHAQSVSSFRDLQVSLKEGDRLIVTEKTGASTTGRLVTLSEQSLRVRPDSTRVVDIEEQSTLRIDQVKRRKGEGALTGFLGGFVVGVLTVALSSDSGYGPSKGTALVPVGAIFGGIGAGIGVLIGSVTSDRRLVFEAPVAAGRPAGDLPDSGVERSQH